MAKKEETPNLVESFAEFKQLKNIDKATMIAVLEDSFRKVLKGMFDNRENFKITLNADNGDVEIFQYLEVVSDEFAKTPGFDKYLQIPLSEAQAEDPETEVGEEYIKEIHFADFGRRYILNLRQTLQAGITELQKAALYDRFKDLVGELVTAEVYQTWSRETLLLDEEKNEFLLPRNETIPGEFFKKGETIRAVISKVDNTNKNPKITVSRTSDEFLRRLFELEVPEIHDGIIAIRAIARIPGRRAKIAVESFDDRIDPVGACVGMKGARIRGIGHELKNENIDVIQYTSNIELFIRRALSPANISEIYIDNDKRTAEVFLKPEEVSKAIGIGGLNIKLASKLTGYAIDVFRDSSEYDPDDIMLDEFKPDIEDWVIQALKGIGCITAKRVLRRSRQSLIDEADLEEETVDNLLKIIREEFEVDEVPDPEAEAPEVEDQPEAEADDTAEADENTAADE